MSGKHIARHRAGGRGLPPALGTALLGGVVLLGFGVIVLGVVR